jgi:hypothetical protein
LAAARAWTLKVTELQALSLGGDAQAGKVLVDYALGIEGRAVRLFAAARLKLEAEHNLREET